MSPHLRRVPKGRCAAVLGDEIPLLPVSGSVRKAVLGRPESLDDAILLFAFAHWFPCDRVGLESVLLAGRKSSKECKVCPSAENVQKETFGGCALRHNARHAGRA
jgi:hypothetical protein